jgi:hypothetical protein
MNGLNVTDSSSFTSGNPSPRVRFFIIGTFGTQNDQTPVTVMQFLSHDSVPAEAAVRTEKVPISIALSRRRQLSGWRQLSRCRAK